MIDNSRARGLQEIYKAHGNGALNALAIECHRIAAVLVLAQCRKYGLRFEREKLEEFSHDSAAQFISQYLKHADYNVRSFSGRIRRDVLNVMFGRVRNKQNSFEDAQLQYDGWYSSHYNGGTLDDSPEPFDPARAMDELRASHPKGSKIAADLARSKSYSQAIMRIASYVGREWIYEHAEKMHLVFKTFRWRPSTSRRLSARRPGGVCDPVLRLGASEFQQPGERPDRTSKRRSVGGAP